MALFRTLSSPEPLPPIIGERVVLRIPQMQDYVAWAELREASRAFLKPWEPTWPVDDLTRGAYRQRLRRYAEDLRLDHAYPFFIFQREGGHLVGGVTIANVRRGVAQAGSIGYWAGEPYAGKGYMSAAVRALLPAAFDMLRLHRLEAACIPTNGASVRLLERTGFRREGYARAYLCIDGLWQDHLLYAQLRTDPRI